MNGWEWYVDVGYFMVLFGKSFLGKDVYIYFGFNEDVIVKKVYVLVEEVWREGVECL